MPQVGAHVVESAPYVACELEVLALVLPHGHQVGLPCEERYKYTYECKYKCKYE